MRKTVFGKWLVLVITSVLMFGSIAYAAEEPAGIPIEEEFVQEELGAVEEEAVGFETADEEEAVGFEAADDAEESVIFEEADDPGELPADTVTDHEEDVWTDEEADAAVPACSMPGLKDVEGSFDAALVEELVGSKISYVTLNTAMSFSCADPDDWQLYRFTPTKSGSYRLDVTGTKKKIEFAMYVNGSSGVEDFDDWQGLLFGNDLALVAQLKQGVEYVFVVAPSSGSDSGKFKLYKTTAEVKSGTIYRFTDRYATVGPTGEGKWKVNDDGTKNFNVWLFSIKEMQNQYKIEMELSNGQKVTWQGTSGSEIGSTGLLVVPKQITDGWKVGQKAYCNLYFGSMMTGNPVEIQYKNTFFKDVLDSSHAYYKAIYWAADQGITKGYDDGTFGINKTCTRGEAVMFLWRLGGKPKPKAVSKSPFRDVNSSNTFYQAILWASQQGITTGYSDGTFKPNATCTRGQIMTFIWRFKKKPAPQAVSKSPFSDVPKSHAYYKAILWGSQKGVTKGFSDGTFGINQGCSRGQIMTFLYRIR